MNNLLLDLMTIKKKVPTKGASGGNLNAYTLTQQNIACSIGPVNSKDLEIYSQRRLDVSHKIWTDQSVNVGDGDRVIVSGNTYSVKGVRTWQDLTVIDCNRFFGGGE